MKKTYIGLLPLAGIFALASCNSSADIITTDTNAYPTNQVNQSVTEGESNNQVLVNTPEYEKPSITFNKTSETSKTTSVEETVEKVYDSVVSISATSVSAQSAGSGVLFGYDSNLGLSYIVTCFHVIDGAKQFEVILSSGKTYTASLVGGYEDLDLAVLSIEASDLCYASIYDDSDALKLGSSVVCIGNPLGTLPGSVSAGVVSYVNRNIQTDAYTTRTLIQTDVAINSGNSGGGLFNTAGALIGIVNAKYSSSGIEGLGFAIPANDVADTITSLLSTANYDKANKVWSYGYVEGDYEFGFTIASGYYSSGYGWNVTRTYVYYVSEISSNTTSSGAEELKLQDIISEVKVDYKDEAKTDTSLTVTQQTDVMSFLYQLDLSIDDVITFTVSRNSQTITVDVPIEQFIYSI